MEVYKMKKEMGGNKEKFYGMRVYPMNTDSKTVEWVAEFPDLPGCVGSGDTPEEAVTMVIDAKKAWIEAAIEDDKNIPEPSNLYESDYSGKFTLRLPKTLHRELTIQADYEGVSLNQYIIYLITKGLNREISATKEKVSEIRLQIEANIISTNSAIETWKRSPFPEEPSEMFNSILHKNRRFEI
jgi:predicted RNase H-like HicB family nuclease